MAFLDDIDAELADLTAGEFSEPAILSWNDGAARLTLDVRGIFDDTFFEVPAEDGAGVVSSFARFTLATTEVEEVIGQRIASDEADDWRLQVRGVDYRITIPERDGAGLALLRLKRVES